MKRFPEIARRAAALALAASMSLSVLAPCASAAVTARDLENSVDELGNVDLTDEVFNVPDDTAADADTLGGDDEEDVDLDDLTEEQLAEQAVVDEAGHTEHTPDTDAEPVYEQPATCAERGYAIYPCSFTLEQEDGTVAHCYHQVVVWLPLADHQWGEWQEPDDADSQKYRVCTVCNAVEYEDGTVVTPGGIPIVDPDQPEWLPVDGQVDTCGWAEELAKKAAKKAAEAAVSELEKQLEGDPAGMSDEKLSAVGLAYKVAKEAIDKAADLGADVANCKARMNALDGKYTAVKQEILLRAAKSAVSTMEDSLKKAPSEMSDSELTEAMAKYEAAKVVAEKAIGEAKDAGVDVSELEARMNAAKKKYDAMGRETFARVAESAVSTMEDSLKKAPSEMSDSELTEAMAKYEAAKVVAEKAIGNAKDAGVDVSELEARMNAAKKKYDAMGRETVARVAESAVSAMEKLFEKDPSEMDDTELATAIGGYAAAKDLAETAVKNAKDKGADVSGLEARMNAVSKKYNKAQSEAKYRTAKAAVKQAEDLINGKDPANMSNEDMAAVIAAYTAAETAVNQLDDSNAGKAELKTRLAALKKTVEEIEAKYAQKVIEDIWNKLKNGELDKSQLEAFKKVLEDLEPIIPDSLKESYEQVVDAVDAAIKAIDLVNNASALIKKLQEEIKNGNISQDTIKQLQELVKQARDLVDQIKENPILKNAVDTIIKNAEKALKEAAANKALDALKEAIKNGDLSKIDEAFDQAQKAIDELRPYAPDVADKLSKALEEIKKTYIHGIKDELEKALEDGTYQEKLDKLKDVVKKYEDMIKELDVSGALKELWDTILNEELTKLITDMANEINKIVNDKDMSALEKIAALNKLSDDLHKQLEDIVGKDRADKLLEPFDKLIEQAKETVAKAAAAAGNSLIKEALKAIKQAVDSAESKEDAINQMESIYDQAHELLTKAGMSDEDATAKLKPVRSAIDSVKKLLDESFVSMDTIKAAVDVLVDAMLESDTIEGGLHDLVRAVLDGKNLDPAVTRAILVVARDVLKKADWSRLTPSLLDDVMDMAIDKVKEKISKKYISPVAKVANELIDELKPTMNDLMHKEVGQDTIDKVRDVFLKALDNGIDGIDKGKSREDLLDTARDDLLGLSPVVSAELKRIGAKAAESINQEMHDKVEAALPGVILPDLIGDLIGNLAEDIVNDEIGKEDPKITAEIDKYVRYLTCPGHKHATRISQAQGCTSDEITEDYCVRCGWVFSSTKTAPALGHDPMLVPGVEPTQDMDGLTDGVQCARCGAWLEPQEVLPALNPEYDKWFVKADVTAETVKATGYQSQQKLDEAIDSALKKAGFEPANSERFLAQVRTNLEIDEGYILPNDRYPEEGVTGMVRFPAKAPGKDGTYYAVQVVTADNHGYNAGDIVVTPLTVTKEGISLKTGVQAVVAIAWKPNN